MKSIARFMAICMLLGGLAFAQAAPTPQKTDESGTKKADGKSMHKSDTGVKKPKKGKTTRRKRSAKKGAQDKGMEKN